MTNKNMVLIFIHYYVQDEQGFQLQCQTHPLQIIWSYVFDAQSIGFFTLKFLPYKFLLNPKIFLYLIFLPYSGGRAAGSWLLGLLVTPLCQYFCQHPPSFCMYRCKMNTFSGFCGRNSLLVNTQLCNHDAPNVTMTLQVFFNHSLVQEFLSRCKYLDGRSG